MSHESILKTYELCEGLQAHAIDTTSHYFGGYFHVRMKIRAVVPVVASSFNSPLEYEDARKRLGESVYLCRILEKMAVPDKDQDAVKHQLLSSFESNGLPYLLRPDFAATFVNAEYRKSLKPAITSRGRL